MIARTPDWFDQHPADSFDMSIGGGGQTYAMTNGGLRIDVILYEVAWFPEPDARYDIVDLDTRPIVVAPKVQVREGLGFGATLAILDFNPHDTSGDPEVLRQGLAIGLNPNAPDGSGADPTVLQRYIANVANHAYRAVMIERDAHNIRGNAVYHRKLSPIMFARRPQRGWDRPTTVYIK